MRMIKYPVVVEVGNSELGAYFPDFAGCVSGGKTVNEALKNACEALKLHIKGMVEDDEELPEPTDKDKVELAENEGIYTLAVTPPWDKWGWKVWVM